MVQWYRKLGSGSNGFRELSGLGYRGVGAWFRMQGKEVRSGSIRRVVPRGFRSAQGEEQGGADGRQNQWEGRLRCEYSMMAKICSRSK